MSETTFAIARYVSLYRYAIIDLSRVRVKRYFDIWVAGIPATTVLSGISFVTTAPAPMVTLLPILTGTKIVTPVEI